MNDSHTQIHMRNNLADTVDQKTARHANGTLPTQLSSTFLLLSSTEVSLEKSGPESKRCAWHQGGEETEICQEESWSGYWNSKAQVAYRLPLLCDVWCNPRWGWGSLMVNMVPPARHVCHFHADDPVNDREERILAVLGIIGTVLNLLVVIFVYIYTTI
ncbi:hypothetical protein UPYG_G00195700 [Umbra pygmaea]|uniref:Uncharacterized protein n=1 Tax=Umbra pygmaea TaxID=75934 RepID=A0ABD0WH37_UMBPY